VRSDGGQKWITRGTSGTQLGRAGIVVRVGTEGAVRTVAWACLKSATTRKRVGCVKGAIRRRDKGCHV
jgi:hypothetical protein